MSDKMSGSGTGNRATKKWHRTSSGTSSRKEFDMSRIRLGGQIKKWKEMKAQTNATTDGQFAKILLNFYQAHKECRYQQTQKPTKSLPQTAPQSSSTPSQPHAGKMSAAFTKELSDIEMRREVGHGGRVSSSSSDNGSIVSGISPIGSTTNGHKQQLLVTVPDESELDVDEAGEDVYTGEDEDEWYDEYEDEDDDNLIGEDDPNDHTWHPLDETLNEDDTVDIELSCMAVDDLVFDINDDQEEDDEEVESVTSDSTTATGSTKRFITYLREDKAEVAAQQEKTLAYTSCIMQLANINKPSNCLVKGCHSKYAIDTKKRGSALFLTWKCEAGHIGHKWCSQPKLPKGVLAGDFSLAASILMSGNNFSKIAFMTQILGMGCISRTGFHKIQALYACPTINEHWQLEMERVTDELHDQPLIVAGDGRMDSPGFSAQYCTYTCMDTDSKNIVSMKIVDKREVELKSPNMETKAFKDTLVDLKNRFDIREVVTDAHQVIAAFMREHGGDTKHSWDCWHGAKNLFKKLTALAIAKATKDLAEWKADIVKHFWWCCQNCEGDEVLLRELWMSVLHHVLNEHRWDCGECQHDEDIAHRDNYLTPGSPSHLALRDLVLDTRFLKNLNYYTNYRSTAGLESFQNHILMYAGKRYAYSHRTYTARCYLAGLDYQYHKDRPYKLHENGDKVYTRVWHKSSNRWAVVPVKVAKEYLYLPALLRDIIQRRLDDTLPLSRPVPMEDDDPRHIAPVIAPIPPPPVAQLIAHQKSRFNEAAPN